MLDRKRKMNKHRPDDSVGGRSDPCWQYTANAVTIVESLCMDTVWERLSRCSHRNMIVIVTLANSMVEIKQYQMFDANGFNISFPNKSMSLDVRKKKNDLPKKKVETNSNVVNKYNTEMWIWFYRNCDTCDTIDIYGKRSNVKRNKPSGKSISSSYVAWIAPPYESLVVHIS